MLRPRPAHLGTIAPKCPAIIFNNSGSMVARGRVAKVMEIIRDTVRMNQPDGVDFYVNDARTGIPNFVTHITVAASGYQCYSAPLIPMIEGDDYINTLGLASVISEYPEGVLFIDDGDGVGGDISDALHLLKSMKSPGYMHPITIFYVRPEREKETVEKYFEHCMRLVPKDEGFDVLFNHAYNGVSYEIP